MTSYIYCSSQLLAQTATLLLSHFSSFYTMDTYQPKQLFQQMAKLADDDQLFVDMTIDNIHLLVQRYILSMI